MHEEEGSILLKGFPAVDEETYRAWLRCQQDEKMRAEQEQSDREIKNLINMGYLYTAKEAVEKDVIARLKLFPIEHKTPMQCMSFIAELSRELREAEIYDL